VARRSIPAVHHLGAAAVTLSTVAACGAGTGSVTTRSAASPLPATTPAASFAPGDVGDCPLPSPTSSATTSGDAATASVGTVTTSTGVIGPGALVTPGLETQTPITSAVPGHPGLALPSPAPTSKGDVAAVVGSGQQAVALHIGRRFTLILPPSQAVIVPSNPDPAVLRGEGRQCAADGAAIFGYATLRPGTVVFVLLPGPRCLHGRPACLPAQREEPLRVDVVP
jgi:hypothetical protein